MLDPSPVHCTFHLVRAISLLLQRCNGSQCCQDPFHPLKRSLADFIASNSTATRIGSWHLCFGMWMQNLFSSITSSAPIMQTSLELIFASITAPGLARFCNRCQYGSQFVLLNNRLSNLPFSAFAIFL